MILSFVLGCFIVDRYRILESDSSPSRGTNTCKDRPTKHDTQRSGECYCTNNNHRQEPCEALLLPHYWWSLMIHPFLLLVSYCHPAHTHTHTHTHTQTHERGKI